MYRITSILNEKEYTIHDPRDPDVQVVNPALDLEMGMSGNLSFMIPAFHPYIDKIPCLTAEIRVYEGNNLIWCGRRMDNTDDFFNTKTIQCEGALAYLLDSIQRPYEYTGSIRDFLSRLLEEHNRQVEPRKQFVLGSVTVIDNNNYINRSNSDFSTTLDAMQDKLVGTHGGFLRVRYDAGVKYLDYVTDYGGTNTQVIRFGENLVDLSKKIDPSTIITALIPRGATLEDGTVVDITSVNGGKDYVFNQDAVDEYGWIWGTNTWQDVTIPNNLLTKAKAYLNEAILLPASIDISALDLSRIDVSVSMLQLGYWTKIISEPHGIDSMFLLSKKHIDLTNAANDTITLGKITESFTASTATKMKDVSAKVDRMAGEVSGEIQKAVDNATELITGGQGGYVVISRSDNGHPEEILVMDAPEKESAKNIIRINKNGVGFSNTGYSGPYANAWTIDGNLIADYIRSGTMYADRIRGGTLTLGGSGDVNGRMEIFDSSNRKIGYWDNTGIRIISPQGKYVLTFDAKSAGGWDVFTAKDDDGWAAVSLSTGNLSFRRSDGGAVDELQIDMDGVYLGDAAGNEAQYTLDVYARDGDFKGDFSVSGSKHRVVETQDYGRRMLNAFETPVPMFGDSGTGEIGDDGLCVIWTDPVFLQTISGEVQVFIQGYGNQNFFLEKVQQDYFIVSGPAGGRFDWQIRARQKGYENERLDLKTEKADKLSERYGAAGFEHYMKYLRRLNDA